MKQIIAIIILAVGCAVLGYLYYQKFNEANELDNINRQNILAHNGELERYKKDSTEFVRKIASVESLAEKRHELLKEREERIISLTRQNIALQKIIDQGYADIDSTDTTAIPQYLIGKTYNFNVSRQFYNYNLSVTLDNPPFHRLVQNFYQDIELINYLSVNKDGIFSGYSNFEPSFVNDYIKISNMKIIIEKDEFYNLGKTKYNKWMFFIDGQVIQTDRSDFALGAEAIVNEQWKFGYKKGFGDNLHVFNVGYNLFNIVGERR